jgi:hypothetical protein
LACPFGGSNTFDCGEIVDGWLVSWAKQLAENLRRMLVLSRLALLEDFTCPSARGAA